MRCPFDRNAPKAFDKAGDVDRFFERVLTYTKDHPELKPTIFSGPAPFTNATQLGENPDMASLVSLSPNPVIDGPWLITLENVFNEAECEHMIQLGYSGGYERSMDVGKKNFDGTFGSDVNPTRTSTNAWCSEGCYDDPLIVNLTARIADITGIHANNSEYWQLLRYEETQQYVRVGTGTCSVLVFYFAFRVSCIFLFRRFASIDQTLNRM